MLAVIHCLLVWMVYLLGAKFVVRTDNVANTYFHSQNKLLQSRLDDKSSCRSMTLYGSTNQEGTIRWLMHLAASRLTR